MKKKKLITNVVAITTTLALLLSGCSSTVSENELTAKPVASKGAKWSETTMPDGWVKVINEGGKNLGYSPDSGISIIEQDGYAFKDLNSNGKLDVYEDWRKDNEKRAKSLASMLTRDEILPLLFRTTPFSDPATKFDALDDATKGRIYAGQRNIGGAQLLQQDGTPAFNNLLQAYAEGIGYSIPVNLAGDPPGGTYSDEKALMGFPAGTLALAATFDPEYVGKVSQEVKKLYRATGLTTILGPQFDLGTEPRWSRIQTTFGEDPALSRDMANAVVSAYQSTYDADGNDLGWGEDSINTLAKHFPGDGMGEGGRESHNDYGKFAVYPGNNFEAHLIPFFDGVLNLDSKTEKASGIMSSYSISYDKDETYGELVGTAFSKYKIGLLRNNGYDGLICSDWGITVKKPWGIEGLTNAERAYMAFKAGIDQLGGFEDLKVLNECWDIYTTEMGEKATLKRLQDSARRILTTYFNVGLFENPYMDSEKSAALLSDENLKNMAKEVEQKSVVMLKNADNTIKPEVKTDKKLTVYIPMTYTYPNRERTEYGWSLPVNMEEASKYYNVVTDTIGEPTGKDEAGNTIYSENDIIRASADELAKCDMAIAFVTEPTVATYVNGGYDEVTGTYLPISLQYGEYKADSKYVRKESIAGSMVEGTEKTTSADTTAKQNANDNAANPYANDNAAGTTAGTRENTSVVNTVKENRSYYGKTAEVPPNATDLDAILYAAENIPKDAKIVVSIGCKGPMVMSEFEDKVDAILVNFDWGAHNYNFNNAYMLDIIAGKVEPSGLLPVQMPASMEAVEAQLEDVPRDMECYVDTMGNTYDFAYGLNWSGVISDKRTAKYGVEPLKKVAAKISLK